MRTTTVRFDVHTMREIKRQAALLDVAQSEYIRVAVLERLARTEHADRLARLEHRVETVARVVRRLARARGHSVA